MIEQVVEFSDKRALEFMTPRPEVVAIPANATVADLRKVLIDTKFSRIPVYEDSLDDITGIAFARDLLQIPKAKRRREWCGNWRAPAFFCSGDQARLRLAERDAAAKPANGIVVDEHGSVAGIVTVEDLVGRNHRRNRRG